eukprot:Opistho-2@86382
MAAAAGPGQLRRSSRHLLQLSDDDQDDSLSDMSEVPHPRKRQRVSRETQVRDQPVGVLDSPDAPVDVDVDAPVDADLVARRGDPAVVKLEESASHGEVDAPPRASDHLCSGFRREKSWNNFKPDILKSGLQKYIRRGVTEKAIYCAGELDLFKESPERGETVRTNFIHRLMVIYLEDVGVGALGLWPHIDTDITFLLEERKKVGNARNKGAEECAVMRLTRLLCAAPKARACSHARALTNRDPLTLQIAGDSFPDVFNMHGELTVADSSARSSSKGDPWAYFERLCALFKNALREKKWEAVHWARRIEATTDVKVNEKGRSKPVWRLFSILESAVRADLLPYVRLGMSWYRELENLKESFCCWLLPLLAHVISVDAPPLAQRQTLLSDAAIHHVQCRWARNTNGDAPIEFDSYVLDQHTAAGRRGSAQREAAVATFALVGAQVTNPSPHTQASHKAFYEAVRVALSERLTLLYLLQSKGAPKSPVINPTSELARFDFVMRTQLVTSSHKTDVYYAIDRVDGGEVIVKGPIDQGSADACMKAMEWKMKNKMQCAAVKVVRLIPDRWPEGTPLGYRNKLADRNAPATFLITPSLVPFSSLIGRVHCSKLWPRTAVLDPDMTPCHVTAAVLARGGTEARDYVSAVVARWIMGIGDLSDRNFILSNGRVISIDEVSFGVGINIANVFSAERREWIRNWLSEHYEDLGVATWSGIPVEASGRHHTAADKRALMEVF